MAKGAFDKTLIQKAWFDETVEPAGWFDDDSLAGVTLDARVSWVEFEVPASLGTSFKKWNGSGWDSSILKRWNGSAWVNTTFRRWNGSAWLPT